MVNPMIVAAGIQAGSQLVGGLMGKDNGKTQFLRQLDLQREAAQTNYAVQKEFAQHGVRWKVDDAKAAGIHPLYALGASTNAASPVATGNYQDYSHNPMPQAVANMGQDIGRAVNATRTQQERNQAHLNSLTVERAGLENELLRSQIASINQQRNPAMPSTAHMGQGDIERLPSQIVASDPFDVSRQAGSINSYQFTAPDRYGVGIVPSEQMKSRIDDDLIGSVLWHLQNRLVAPQHPDPDKYWNPILQRYRNNPIPRKYRFIK